MNIFAQDVGYHNMDTRETVHGGFLFKSLH